MQLVHDEGVVELLAMHDPRRGRHPARDGSAARAGCRTPRMHGGGEVCAGPPVHDSASIVPTRLVPPVGLRRKWSVSRVHVRQRGEYPRARAPRARYARIPVASPTRVSDPSCDRPRRHGRGPRVGAASRRRRGRSG